MILADTDVLIDALNGRQPAKGRITLELGTGKLATSTITVYELLSGARTEKARAQVDSLLAAMSIVPLDETASRRAAAVRQSLESSGQGIGTADSLIAGIVLSRSAVLLTRNLAHFQRVPGLILGTL